MIAMVVPGCGLCPAPTSRHIQVFSRRPRPVPALAAANTSGCRLASRLPGSAVFQSLPGHASRGFSLRQPMMQPLRAAGDQSDAGVTPSQQDIDWANTLLLFVFPALGGLLFGYDIGATSGALVSLKSTELSGTDWGPALTAFQSGAVVSSSLAGALLGSFTTLGLGNKIGRRDELMLAALLYGGSGFVMSSAQSFEVLAGAHLAYGLGIGFAMHAAPAYIAETAPKSVRGFLISLKEGFIVGGILLGYLASYSFIGAEGGWRLMYGSSSLVALTCGLGMLALPESPRWLQLSGTRTEQVPGALERTMGKKATEEEVRKELGAIEKAALKDAEAGDRTISDLFTNSEFRQPLFVGLSLMLFQQITGQPSVLYYAAKIFQDAGFSDASEATKVSVILGIFKLAATGIAVVKVDSWGRRPLLLAGVGGMIVSLGLLSSTSFGIGGAAPPLVSVGALLLYVGCYQLSFGPISWLIVGEVFPLAVRGQALALATMTNFGSNFGVSLVLPYAQDSLGLGGLYLVFAGIGGLAWLSIYNNVPETRGKTLEEIEQFWKEPQAEDK